MLGGKPSSQQKLGGMADDRAGIADLVNIISVLNCEVSQIFFVWHSFISRL
jgi:hypothetical protein